MMTRPQVIVLFLVMVCCLAWLDTTMAQSQHLMYEERSSEERLGTVPSGPGHPPEQTSPGGPEAALRGSSGGSAIKVIPLISASERYDTNVLLSTRKEHDYVTSVRPGARVTYEDDLVQGDLTGSLISEVYARNPELNYVGVNALLNASLDNLVGRMIRGLGLRFMDTVRYTPQAQAFLTPQAPELSPLRGMQAYRNNSLLHSARVESAYAMSPLTQFNAAYSYQKIEFFNQTIPGVTGVAGSLFNTSRQSFVGGPEYRITPTQSIGISYQYQHSSIVPSTGVGTGFTFASHGAMATWKSSFTREITAELAPGVAIVESIPDKPQLTMQGLLQWSDGLTSARLGYTRGIYPSFFLTATALISDVVAASFSQTLSSHWSASAGANYANNRSVSQSNFSFETVSETVSVSYTVSPGIVASLSGVNSNFKYGLVGSSIHVDRQAVMLNFTAEWD